MTSITRDATLTEVAALVSDALDKAGIVATLSGGAAVAIYTENAYQSKGLDFVTSAMVTDLAEALQPLGFIHAGSPTLATFEHPLVEWFIEFPPSPLTFGQLHVDPAECRLIDLSVGQLRIITPTHSVMDRLAAAIHWHDPQSRELAILVAVSQDVDWIALKAWFEAEGERSSEYERFREAVAARSG